MFEMFDEWKPMNEDFESISFNSYIRGPGSQLPLELLPNFKFGTESTQQKSNINLKLFIEGFSAELTESGLKTFIERLGCKPLSVKIIHNKIHKNRPFSFVDFDSLREASKAIELIKNQKLYKLNVSFASTETDKLKKSFLIEKEKELILEQMKPTINLSNSSVVNSNGNSSISPISSEYGNGDASRDHLMASFAKSDKMVKFLMEANADCSVCNATPNVEHLHYILSENQVLDPSQLPDLMTPSCLTCGSKSANLKVCAECKTALYCSRRCQSSNWLKHSRTCRPNANHISPIINCISQMSLSTSSLDQNESRVNAVNTSFNQIKSQSIQTPKVVIDSQPPPKESTPLTVDVNFGLKSKVSETQTQKVVSKTNESLLQISNDCVEQKIAQLESANKSNTSVSSDQMNVNRVKHTIIPFKGDLSLEEISDGEENVAICFGQTPFDFYLQKTSSFDKIALLSEKLNEKVKDFPQLSEKDLKVGALCGGIYSVDNECYRAKVLCKVDDETYALHFVDYGNTEPVNIKDIKALPSIYFECKAQGIHCSLHNIVPTGGSWDEKALKMFEQMGESGDYSKVRIFEKTSEGIYKIDLIAKNGDSLTENFIKSKFCKRPNASNETNEEIRALKHLEKCGKTPISSPEGTPNKNETLPKVVFNRSSLKDANVVRNIRLQSDSDSVESNESSELKSCLDAIETNSKVSIIITGTLDGGESQFCGIFNAQRFGDLAEELKLEYSSSNTKCVPRKGDFVVTKMSDDELYRCYVIGVEGNVAKVFAVDTGYHEEVDVTQVYKMSAKYYKVPALLVVFVPKTKAEQTLVELSAANDVPVIDGLFVKQNRKNYVQISEQLVELLDYKSSIDLLTSSIKTPKVVDYYQKIAGLKLDLNKRLEALVLYQQTDDPKVFFVAGNDEILQNVMTKCSQLSATFNEKKSVKPIVGNIYLVKSPDDEWYRAIITSVEEKKCKVLFIDFGNVDVIEEKLIMNLTPDLEMSILPAVAIKCVVESSDLDPQVLTKKIEQAADGAFLLKMQPIKYVDFVHHVIVY